MQGSALGLENPELRSDPIAEPPTEVGALLGLLKHCQSGCAVPEEAESPARRKWNAVAVAVGVCSELWGFDLVFHPPSWRPPPPPAPLAGPRWGRPRPPRPGRRARGAGAWRPARTVRQGSAPAGPPPARVGPRWRPAPGGPQTQTRGGREHRPPKNVFFFFFFRTVGGGGQADGTGIIITSGIIADPTLFRWPGSFRTVRRRCKPIPGSSSGGGG